MHCCSSLGVHAHVALHCNDWLAPPDPNAAPTLTGNVLPVVAWFRRCDKPTPVELLQRVSCPATMVELMVAVRRRCPLQTAARRRPRRQAARRRAAQTVCASRSKSRRSARRQKAAGKRTAQSSHSARSATPMGLARRPSRRNPPAATATSCSPVRTYLYIALLPPSFNEHTPVCMYFTSCIDGRARLWPDEWNGQAEVLIIDCC